MNKPSEFRILRFLIAADRLAVHQVSEIADAAKGTGVSVTQVLVHLSCISDRDLSLATAAVQAIDDGMTNVLALVLFECAIEKNISFQEAAWISNRRRVRLGELLVDGRFINKTQLEAALTLTSWGGLLIGEALVRIKAISLDVLQNSLQCQALVNAGELTAEQAIFVLHYATNFKVSCDTAVQKFRLKATCAASA
jgi:hypothetical protein